MMSALPAFGQGQTWQDVTGSRAMATTYTNTSGKPIAVIISLGGSAGVTLTIGGVTNYSSGATPAFLPPFIVPKNTAYIVSGNAAIQRWIELR